jgi:hypothetical protein
VRRRIVLGLLAVVLPLSVSLSQDEDNAPPVSAQDLAILLRAKELLADEAHWNRHDDRNCPPQAKTYSLFCALQKASVEVLGEYEHRRAALQEVRFARRLRRGANLNTGSWTSTIYPRRVLPMCSECLILP